MSQHFGCYILDVNLVRIDKTLPCVPVNLQYTYDNSTFSGRQLLSWATASLRTVDWGTGFWFLRNSRVDYEQMICKHLE